MLRPLPEYQMIETELIPVLYGLPPKIIAIDGLNGTGKTTLARYLSHRFNCSLIETDLFMSKAAVDYRFEEMKKNVVSRIVRTKRPIFIEGVAVLRTLSKMSLVPDFHIYWENVDQKDLGLCRVDRLGVELLKYRKEFTPVLKTNLHVKAIVKVE